MLWEYKDEDFEVFINIRNGLNILDVVCLLKLLDVVNKFCIYVFENKLWYKIDLMKIDLLGWNIGYYVLMFGCVELLKFMEKNEMFCFLIKK